MTKKLNNNGLFGNPKPLPGQKNFNLKESEKLEQHTNQMEENLKNLRLQLLEDRKKNSCNKNNHLINNDNRWDNARLDKGSIKHYAQDVKERNNNNNNTKIKRKSRKEEKPIELDNNNNNKVVEIRHPKKWTVDEVFEWLRTIELYELSDIFKDNNITGTLLLDITNEDLDYLKITKLGTRKLFLRHLEGLKKSIGWVDKYKDHIKFNNTNKNTNYVENNKEMIHWSNVRPLVENEKKKGFDHMETNSADRMTKEEIDHNQYMESIIQLKASDLDNNIINITENEEHGIMWSNPICENIAKKKENLLNDEIDEQKEHAEFVAAVEAWRKANKKNDTINSSNNNKFSTGNEDEKKQSCWQCYKVFWGVNGYLDDAGSNKLFCSTDCLNYYNKQYSRFYNKKS